MILRVVVGLVGGLVLVAGARWYRRTLSLTAFAVGAIGAGLAANKVVTLLHLAEQQMMIVGLASAIGGATLAGMTKFAHKIALAGLGALLGLTVGGAVVAQLAAVPPVTIVLATVLGALVFPWIYDQLLKVLTPAVGAVLVAWAVGHPEHLGLLGGLWFVGVALQIRGPSSSRRDDDEDG
ncbi:MAG: hypothetical protein GWP91_11895 [Rhodobacterales bacterium]|nr:hypothetical protein [Rhodobacterales bacterium]